MANDPEPLRILLLGDASNYHSTLAAGLRRAGHDVTVASDGTRWMDTRRDVDLSRRPGKAGGLTLWLRMRFLMAHELTGYDIVSASGTHFATLRPQRLRSIFDYIRRNNRHVFLTALGTDTFYIDECLDPSSPLRYSEWRVGDSGTPFSESHADTARAWQAPPLRDYCRYIADNVDGVVTALYEYDLAMRRAVPPGKIAYGGIPVDTASVTYTPAGCPPKVRMLLGYHSGRMLEKGAERLLAAARQVAADYPDRCELDVVCDRPLTEFEHSLRRAHVVIDQLYSYTPATTALMAMAMGKTVVSGGEPQYYDFIGEPRLRPVVNVRPTDSDREIYETLLDTVLRPGELERRGAEGRQLVERHNSADVVARRFLDFWSSRIAAQSRCRR